MGSKGETIAELQTDKILISIMAKQSRRTFSAQSPQDDDLDHDPLDLDPSKDQHNDPPSADNKDVVRQEDVQLSMDSILKEALETPLEEMAPATNMSLLSQDTVTAIITRVANTFQVPLKTAFTAIALLFLKGAANKSAPPSMSVDIRAGDKAISVSKYDIQSAYSATTGNPFVRRLAETMATPISQFAEANHLQGDLAVSINNAMIAKDEDPLSAKEKAWASSFCQKNPDIQTEAPRVARYLALDYQKRFDKKKQKGAQQKGQKGKGNKERPVPPAASQKIKK